MHGKTSFFKAAPKIKLKVLCFSILLAILGSCFIALIVHLLGSDTSKFDLGFYALFTPVGFCSGLSFYDSQYTGLRLIGTLIGACTGVLTAVLITEGVLFSDLGFYVFFSVLFAFFGYFVVGREEILIRSLHW